MSTQTVTGSYLIRVLFLWLPNCKTTVITARMLTKVFDLLCIGPYGFPLDESVQAFFDALLLFSTTVGNEVRLRNLHLVCYDQDTAMAVIVILRSLLDCKMSEAAVSASDRYGYILLRYQLII